MCVGTSLERDLKELFRHASVSSTYPGKTGITVVLRRITVVLRHFFFRVFHSVSASEPLQIVEIYRAQVVGI